MTHDLSDPRKPWFDKHTLRISDVRKGLRVHLAYEVPVGRARSGAGIDAPGRISGTCLSPRVLTTKPLYGENIGVRVRWDGFRTPEFWSLAELVQHPSEWAKKTPASPLGAPANG